MLKNKNKSEIENFHHQKILVFAVGKFENLVILIHHLMEQNYSVSFQNC